MARKDLSLTGALAGGMAGWVAEVAIQEVTGHHVTTGLLELMGAAAGLWRLDRRLADSLRDTLDKAKDGQDEDYRQVKARIAEILHNMVDAGIQAQKA